MKTAEEVLKAHIVSPEGGWEPTDHDAVIEAMKEYAKQFIDLAAQEARAFVTYDHRDNTHGEVDMKSILKLKERVV